MSGCLEGRKWLCGNSEGDFQGKGAHQIFSGEHPPSLAQGMPQFTFACFCGLHGFCKMKRKKEEVHRERETAV
ncbi:bladder cancer associated transcript 1 isoform X1 [Callorhinus ursinus]|uniref:bladder cancer associated transcript 1 isoform X1 n=1 Tax=Callorhinus ursinus TaxID=34884 RepID=UPI003CD027FA